MYTTVRCQAHEVEFLAIVLCVLYSSNQLRILRNRAISNGAVDFEKVLIYHAAATNIEVTYLTVTHLTSWKTYVLAACLKLRVRIYLYKMIPIWSRSVENNITLAMITYAPTVKYHQ